MKGVQIVADRILGNVSFGGGDDDDDDDSAVA
jgi:hypothetical protein